MAVHYMVYDVMPHGMMFLLLPTEIRLAIYKHIFHNFTLAVYNENILLPYELCTTPRSTANQICRANKQIRLEAIPVLARCTHTIAAPMLLPQKPGEDGRGVPDPTFKPLVIDPRLNDLFRANIRNFSISLQSSFVPSQAFFPNLKKIAIDVWMYGTGVIATSNDKDLIAMTKVDVQRPDAPEEAIPAWLATLEKEKKEGVKLALRVVWKVDEKDQGESYLKALVNVTDGKVIERQLGPKTLEEVDISPPTWLSE